MDKTGKALVLMELHSGARGRQIVYKHMSAMNQLQTVVSVLETLKQADGIYGLERWGGVVTAISAEFHF